MSCNTDIESEAWLTFFWNVENYSYCWQENDDAVLSPRFKVGMIENATWHLLVYPNGYIEEDSISYFLGREFDAYSESPEIKYDLAILAEDGSVLQTNKKERTEEGSYWGSGLSFLREDVKVTRKEAFLSKDTLRLRCRVWRTDGKNVMPARFFARTVLNVKNWNFLWNIEGFSSLKSDETATYEIRSESKSVDMIFSISMNKKGVITICREYIDMSINFLKFQPFITLTNGAQIDCGKRETSTFVEDVSCTLPLTKKYLMDNKNLYLENDVLTLYCECSWSDGFALKGKIERIDYGILSPSVNKVVITKSCSPPTEVSHFDKMLDLKEDFHCLYAEGIFSDVKLRTTTQTFPAHKNILSIRSPVFRAMFTTDMKENIQKCVDIPDLEDDTVRRMLLYMYTNALEDLQWESALKLYAAADKYEIFALKSKCCSFLKCNLCPNNLCDVLVLADMHVDSDLKEAAQVYAFEGSISIKPVDIVCKDESCVSIGDNALEMEQILNTGLRLFLKDEKSNFLSNDIYIQRNSQNKFF